MYFWNIRWLITWMLSCYISMKLPPTAVIFTSMQTHGYQKLLADLTGWLLFVISLHSLLHCEKQPVRRRFTLIPNVFSTILLKFAWTKLNPILTSNPLVWTFHKIRQLLYIWTAGPDVPDGRGWTLELRPEQHSWYLKTWSPMVWMKNTIFRWIASVATVV